MTWIARLAGHARNVRIRRGATLGVIAVLAAAGVVLAVTAAQPREIPWIANGRDVEGTRYLPATGITRDTVSRLAPAWTYRTGEMGPQFKTVKPTSFEATPLVLDGTMYVGTALGRVIALDAAT